MEALLIFNRINDVILSKYNEKFARRMQETAKSHGFMDWNNYKKIPPDVIVQIFSPIITSQKIMTCQFGNAYTSMQCEDGSNICFDEYMGYAFLIISTDDVQFMKKSLSICITLVKHLCGPDVSQVEDNEDRAKLFISLLNAWRELQENDQTFCVEAVEQLVINSDLSSSILGILGKSVEKLHTSTPYTKIHSLVLAKNKFLSLYSSQDARELESGDIIFLILLAYVRRGSFQVLLTGCLTHIVHIIDICKDIVLVYLFEVGNVTTSMSLDDCFTYLHELKSFQVQSDQEMIKTTCKKLEISLKKLTDSLKKTKNTNVNKCTKDIKRKWGIGRQNYQEYLKENSDESLLKAETTAANVFDSVRELLILLNVDNTLLFNTKEQTGQVAKAVVEKLVNYRQFIRIKADRNFSLGSRESLTINKYLEEFPGLVHFLYIDRNSHRVTTPNLELNDDDSSETLDLMKNKVWNMIMFSWSYLRNGNMVLIWKDKLFTYGHFVWFENMSGVAIKPEVDPVNSDAVLPMPGLLGIDFYNELKKVCFPKTPPHRIRCYEIFCMHLRLVSASLVLEHVKRLANTVFELRGPQQHPIDLL